MGVFWLGVGIGILCNLATGLLLSIVFETLQRRRDLQRQLGELWLLATRASEAVNHSGLRKDGGAEAYAHWLALQDEWLRARHSLNFALTEEQRTQLEDSISAIYELHILNSDKRNRRFLKLHPITMMNESMPTQSAAGTPTDTPDFANYGTWALHNAMPEEKIAYDEFQAHREKLNQKIEVLLHFNPFAGERRGFEADVQSLPDELAQKWDFGFLFSRVWKWFFLELSRSFSRVFRD
jgi:hypothetical protein